MTTAFAALCYRALLLRPQRIFDASGSRFHAFYMMKNLANRGADSLTGRLPVATQTVPRCAGEAMNLATYLALGVRARRG